MGKSVREADPDPGAKLYRDSGSESRGGSVREPAPDPWAKLSWETGSESYGKKRKGSCSGSRGKALWIRNPGEESKA